MEFDIKEISGNLITYTAIDGTELQGFLVKSKKKTNKVVIHVHGLTGNFFRSLPTRKIIPFYLTAGYDFLSINTRGHDIVSWLVKVKGKKRKGFSAGTAFEKFEDCVKDIGGIVDFVAKKGYKNIVLQGHSTGCQKATYYVYKIRDKRVSSIVLLAPADDYNVDKKKLGKKWKPAVKLARKLAKKNPNSLMPLGMTNDELFSAQRFLSLSDKSRVEARIFDYEVGSLKEFSNITCPILAIFGSKEQYRTKPVRIYLDQLKIATKSKKFQGVEIKGANHSFQDHEQALALSVVNWLNKT